MTVSGIGPNPARRNRRLSALVESLLAIEPKETLTWLGLTGGAPWEQIGTAVYERFPGVAYYF